MIPSAGGSSREKEQVLYRDWVDVIGRRVELCIHIEILYAGYATDSPPPSRLALLVATSCEYPRWRTTK